MRIRLGSGAGRSPGPFSQPAAPFGGVVVVVARSGRERFPWLPGSPLVPGRHVELTSPTGRVGRDAAEHAAILDAFLAGSPRRARAAMVTHLRNVAAEMMDVLSGRDVQPVNRRLRSTAASGRAGARADAAVR